MNSITKDNLRYAGIDDWRKNFDQIYGPPDSKLSVEDTWAEVLIDASSVGENIRREEYNSVLAELAHTFCWFCSFISRSSKETERPYLKLDIVKYPGYAQYV